MPTHNGDVNANQLYISLMDSSVPDFPVIDFDNPAFKLPYDPESDLYKNVRKIANEDLSTGVVNGTGTFDVLMEGFKVHLKQEFDANRISGAEYTKAWIALTQSAMQQAVQFLLGKDAAYWQAVIAQAQAIAARIALETAKMQYLSILMEVLNGRAQFALTKLKLATEDVTFATGEYQLNVMLPQQLKLLIQQTDAAAAQTKDGFVGLIGKQKDLYTQQIASYIKDAEIKIAKLYTDAWTVMKTMDEGLLPPDSFSNANIDAILGGL